MIKEIKFFAVDKYCDFMARRTYPESLKNGLDDILQSKRKIKVCVIDDHAFPFEDMLDNEGCIVKCHRKITKDTIQIGQKLKTISLGSPDIIFCDINGVGEELYKEYKGLGVIDNLRAKFPFCAIYAYTGNPGFATTKLKNLKTIDGIFAKEWSADDFLFNFNKIKKKFSCSYERWVFLRERLSHLDASEKKIDELRMAYIKSILLSKFLHKKMNLTAAEIVNLIALSENKSLDLDYWAKFGIKSAEIYSLFSPLMVD